MKNQNASESQMTMSETYLSNKRRKATSVESIAVESISKDQIQKLITSKDNNIKAIIDDWEDSIDKDDLLNSIDHFIELEDHKCDFLNIESFRNQKLISQQMRSKLFDWMMLVCTHKEFNRDTFHLAIRICDIVFCRLADLHSSQLQLVAVTSIYIASKFEEDPVSPNVLSDITENYVSKQEILKFELKVLNILGWKLRHSTLSIWANYITYQWDLWRELKIQNGSEYLEQLPRFWGSDNELEEKSHLLNMLFKCVDLALHDINYFTWQSSKLISAILYIVVGTQMGTINSNSFLEEDNDIDFSQLYDLNDIIDSFLSEVVESSVSELSFYLKVAKIIYSSVREDTIFKVASTKKQNSRLSQAYIDCLKKSTSYGSALSVLLSQFQEET